MFIYNIKERVFEALRFLVTENKIWGLMAMLESTSIGISIDIMEDNEAMNYRANTRMK